jgi:hypothetical protein
MGGIAITCAIVLAMAMYLFGQAWSPEACTRHFARLEGQIARRDADTTESRQFPGKSCRLDLTCGLEFSLDGKTALLGLYLRKAVT